MVTESKISEFLSSDYRRYALHVLENRAIPSVIDGQKPIQRKIFFTALKHVKNVPNKVSTLAGKVISDAMYHNGNVSCENAVVLMTQEFKNNIPYFDGVGQFGSLKNPFSSSSRYISVQLSPLIQDVFKDEFLLDYKVDEDCPIEPSFYLPTIPLVLVNGSSGIALGYSTNILNRDPSDIIDYCLSIVKNVNSKPKMDLLPKVNGFVGKFERDQDNHKKWNIFGKYEMVNQTSIRITEIVPSMTYEKYEAILDALVDNKIILSYENLSSSTINYLIKIPRGTSMSEEEIIKTFKLRESETEIFTTLDEFGKLKIFDSVEDIIKYFINFRLSYYQKRKDYQLQKSSAELKVLGNKGKFIKFILDGKITINNKSKADVSNQIEKNGLDKIDGSYEYLLRMPIYSLTVDSFEDIKNQFTLKKEEIEEIKKLIPEEMYISDLKDLKKKIK